MNQLFWEDGTPKSQNNGFTWRPEKSILSNDPKPASVDVKEYLKPRNMYFYGKAEMPKARGSK